MVRLIFSNSYIDKYKYGLNMLQGEAFSLEMQSYIIVPRHLTLQSELEILELLNVKGLFNLDIMNMDRFIKKFSSEKNAIDDIGQILILLNIINKNRDRLKLYAKSAKNLGFVENLSTLIHELRSNFIEPSQIEFVMKELEQENALLRHKLSEISLIYGEYCRYINMHEYDESEMIKAFIQEIPKTKAWKKTSICIEGFSDLNNSYLNLLAHLSHHVGYMQIRLVSAAEDTPMYHHIERFKSRIIEVFHSHGIDVEVIYAEGEANAFCKDMQSIFMGENRFSKENFKTSGDQVAENAHISTVCSLNPKEEIKNVVYQIVADCRDRNYKLSDFAVLSENISEYEHLIKEVCRTFKIPYFVSNKNSLINNDYAEFILSSLKIILAGYQTQDVMRFLKNRFVGLSARSIAKIGHHALGFDLKYAHRWKKFIDTLTDDFIPPDDADKLSSCMSELFQLGKNLKSASNISEFIEHLKVFLSSFELQNALSDMSKDAQKDGDLGYAQELAQIYSLIDGIFSQILMISEFELSVKNVYELLFFAFCSIRIGILPQDSESLFFGNIKLNKLSRLKKLYIINMSEGVIPARQDETGLFSFSERELLNRYRFLNMKDYSYEYNLATYNLYENMHGISDEVIWSYPLLLQNEPNLPSIWYAALTEFGLNPEFLELTDEEIKKSGIAHLYFDRLLNKLMQKEKMSEEECSHLKYFAQAQEWSEKFRAVLQGVEYLNLAVIDRNKLSAKKIFKEHLNVSVSRLEKFAKCPYQHFVDYILTPKQPPEYRFTSLDIGNLFHDMFERIMNYMSELQVSHFEPQRAEEMLGDSITFEKIDSFSDISNWDREFEKYYAIVLEENPKFLLNARNVYFANRFKEILKNAVKYNIIQLKLTKFKNIYNELSIGKGASGNFIDSLEIVNDEFKKISIIGKIDRIDIAQLTLDAGENAKEGKRDEALQEKTENYFRIIDYKSGSTEFNQKLFDAGLSLQLPIYLNMILNSRQMKEIGAKPYGAFYFVIPNEILLEQKTGSSVLAEFALNGILLEDENINRQLDLSIELNQGKSLISPYEKDPKARSKASRLMMSDENMKTLLEQSRNKAAQLAQEIYEMNISIAPVGNLLGYKPCDFCKYIDICKFDTSDDRQGYRYIK